MTGLKIKTRFQLHRLGQWMQGQGHQNSKKILPENLHKTRMTKTLSRPEFLTTIFSSHPKLANLRHVTFFIPSLNYLQSIERGREKKLWIFSNDLIALSEISFLCPFFAGQKKG